MGSKSKTNSSWEATAVKSATWKRLGLSGRRLGASWKRFGSVLSGSKGVWGVLTRQQRANNPPSRAYRKSPP